MAKKDPIIHAEAEVRALQKILGVPETGAFDAATNTALFKKTVEWQATFNQGKEPKDRLKVDGWMGPKTLEALGRIDTEAYKALRKLEDEISLQRGAKSDGKSAFGLGTLQSRIEGENGHPPKGQELNAGQVKAITGRDLAVTQAESEARHPDVPYYDGRYALGLPQLASTTGAINENGLSDAEKAALGGAAVAGFTAAAWKGFGPKPAPVSPGTGLAVKEQLMPKGSATVGVEKDVTPRGSAETSGPNRPGRVAKGAIAETEAIAAGVKAETGTLAKTTAIETGAAAKAGSALEIETAAAKEASWLVKAWRPVAGFVGKVAKPVAVVADPLVAASTAPSGHRVAAAASSMATVDYVLGGLAVFGGAVVAPVAMTTIGLKAAWEQGAEDYAAEQAELAEILAPGAKKEIDLLKGAENRYGDLVTQVALAAGKPVGSTEEAARYLQDKDVFDKVWNHYQDKAEEATRDGQETDANDASLNMALLQEFMKTETARKAAEEKFKDDRDPMRAMGKNTDPAFVPVF